MKRLVDAMGVSTDHDTSTRSSRAVPDAGPVAVTESAATVPGADGESDRLPSAEYPYAEAMSRMAVSAPVHRQCAGRENAS